MTRPFATGPRGKRAAGLYAIIAFKFGKGLLLLLLAFGIFSLVGDDLKLEFERLIRWIHLDPEMEFFSTLGQHLGRVTPEHLKWVASGSMLYGLLLSVEGVGLVARAFWAAWLAIGETAFFIPIEMFDLLRRPTLVVGLILIANTLIVAYLIRNRDRLFRHHGHESRAARAGGQSA